MCGLKHLSALMVGLMCWQQGAGPKQVPASATAGPSVAEIPAERQTFPGVAEQPDDDCPVVASNVAIEADYDPARNLPLWLVHKELRIENRSNLSIRRVSLGTSLRVGPTDHGFDSSFDIGMLLRPGEVRMEVQGGTTKLGLGTPWNGEIRYTIWVRGVEYEDGSHWASARTYKRPLKMGILPDEKAPLSGCGGNFTVEQTFRGNCRVTVDGVVAYRFGMVRDTPDEFEVKLGKWVELAEPSPKIGTKFPVSIGEEGDSLQLEDYLKRERYDITKNGFTKVGARLFLAEVRFADGTVWKRSLKREDLLWDAL